MKRYKRCDTMVCVHNVSGVCEREGGGEIDNTLDMCYRFCVQGVYNPEISEYGVKGTCQSLHRNWCLYSIMVEAM